MYIYIYIHGGYNIATYIYVATYIAIYIATHMAANIYIATHIWLLYICLCVYIVTHI